MSSQDNEYNILFAQIHARASKTATNHHRLKLGVVEKNHLYRKVTAMNVLSICKELNEALQLLIIILPFL